MGNPSTTLQVRHYDLKVQQPMSFDLAEAYRAEHRIQDIAFAKKSDAKELFATFTRAYILLAKHHALLKVHIAKAAIAARKRRAVLMLDIIPGKAKEAGLATARAPTGSEDVREAYYYSDQEYVHIEEARAALEGVEALLFSKMLAMRDAMDAVKALLSPDEVPRLSSPVPREVDPAGRMVEEGTTASLDQRVIARAAHLVNTEDGAAPSPSKPVSGFGKPRYQD